ncbi:MAG: sulfotransferase family protein [Solirubrobacteraceae bacterium]
MKLIGVGLPRTATLTQKVALEMLGIGPCYHMVNVLADLKLIELWRDALEGRPDWERIFAGFQSTVDWPGGFFYKDLIEAYPEAKVLLSVRDPAAWERSMRETVWGVIHGDTLMCHLSLARAAVDPQWRSFIELLKALLWEGSGTLAERHAERDGLIEAMHRHTEEVRRAVPAERLLVWNVTEGWEPLCEFLQVEVPAVPMPHVNDSREFGERVIEMAMGTLTQWWAAQRA